MWLNLLLIIKKYWKPILLFICFISVLLYGYGLGSSYQKAKCETTLHDMHKAEQLEKQALQSNIDKLSVDYQEKKTEIHKKQNVIERKYDVERKTNPSVVCRADAKFVQLYNEITEDNQK
jgi:hypothetical protein